MFHKSHKRSYLPQQVNSRGNKGDISEGFHVWFSKQWASTLLNMHNFEFGSSSRGNFIFLFILGSV